jgi:hypothetical protein
MKLTDSIHVIASQTTVVLRKIADTLMAEVEARYRAMVCSCGEGPAGNEPTGSGCYTDDGLVKFICGSCWLKADRQGPR